ncbi:MAG: hypothetical protein K2Q06_15620, partial [Parvularculaceae bacterium]|nr:hypothetical protein [Parvularculaceae bacterium]
MTSGRDALHRIDQAIAEARRMMNEASGAVAEVSRTAAALDARELDAFRALAQVRAELLTRGAPDSALGPVDRKARDLLARQDAFVAEAAAARDAAAAAVER